VELGVSYAPLVQSIMVILVSVVLIALCIRLIMRLLLPKKDKISKRGKGLKKKVKKEDKSGY
jgi:membrane protein implicated in regulation of membrane protease activity